MTRGRYYLLWIEMLLRGVLTMAAVTVLFNWGMGSATPFNPEDLFFALIVYVPVYCLVMLPVAVNFVLTARWTLVRCIVLSTCVAMIVPMIRIFSGLVGAARGGWWPDWLLLIGYIGGGLVFGLLIGILFWLSGLLFPWTWRVSGEAEAP